MADLPRVDRRAARRTQSLLTVVEWVFGLGRPQTKRPRGQRWHPLIGWKGTACGAPYTATGTAVDVLESGVELCHWCDRKLWRRPSQRLVKELPDDCEVILADELDRGDVLRWFGRRLEIVTRRVARHQGLRGWTRVVEFTSPGWPSPLRLYADQVVMREMRKETVEKTRGDRLAG